MIAMRGRVIFLGLDFPQLVFLLLGICTCIAWLVFARMSMRRIEKKVREEGNDRTGWDGIGGRAIWYAGAIVLPIGRANRPNSPLIDPVAVQRHATAGDRKRAWWLVISMCSWLGSILLLHFLDRS